jgi:hypothetical protein
MTSYFPKIKGGDYDNLSLSFHKVTKKRGCWNRYYEMQRIHNQRRESQFKAYQIYNTAIRTQCILVNLFIEGK